MVKGERVLVVGPRCREYPCLLSLRTGLWTSYLGLTVQLQAIWLWLDLLSRPPHIRWWLFRVGTDSRFGFLVWYFGSCGYKDDCHAPTSLSELPSTSGTCEQSRSETLPTHLRSICGLCKPWAYGNHDLK